MARTQAVYYRDKRGVEPVDRFIDALPAKRAAKIDDHVEEHLNRKPPAAPPPEFPITSQIEGERPAKTRRRRAEEGIDWLIQIDKLGGR